MNVRRTITKFLNFPLHVKIIVGQKVGVWKYGDSSISDAEKFRQMAQRADSIGKLREFLMAIDNYQP